MNSTQERSKRTKSSPFHSGRSILFLAGCALGAVCFLWVYGAGILNPVYDDWLLNGDMDLMQHYIGFCHYRMSAWRFPFGMIDTLSYPTSMSVIYTDSIPLAALFFKIFNGILPVHFQYFGIFGLVSFMLTGGLSSLLTYSLISGSGRDDAADNNKADDKNGLEGYFSKSSDGRIPFINRNLPYVLSLCASIIYILSFTVLQRMFYHTALGAQWIVILSLYIWIERAGYSKKKTIIVYSLMGLLCVGIHSYYVPMAGSILLASSVEKAIGMIKKDALQTKIVIRDEFINILGFCALGLITLFAFGAFHGPSGGYDEGLGSFTSNLNTFINPIYGSIIIKPMKLYYDFQYEGYGYLGIGVFMLLAVSLVYLVGKIRAAGFKVYFREHIRAAVFLCLLLIDFMLAVLPMVTFSDKKIFGVPLPGFVRSAAGIFRSNGRFIWVPVYLIFTGSVVCSVRLFSERFGKMDKGKGIVLKLLLVIVLFQVLDTTRTVSDKQAYFKERQVHGNVWEGFSLPQDKYSEFVFLYNENDIIMDTAFYAYLNGMRLNSYYYARDIDDAIDKDIEGKRKEIEAGNARDDAVYICRKDDPISEAVTGIFWVDLDEEHLAGMKFQTKKRTSVR